MPTHNRFQNKVICITGGASGIGKALAEAFSEEGAHVVIVDLRGHFAVAEKLGAMAVTCDVTDAAQVRKMIQAVRQRWGRIDIYFSNAGIMIPPTADATKDHVAKYSDDQWTRVLNINLQSHVIAARELITTDDDPWDGGIFVVKASAAGVLAIPEDASYGVSKAAAVSFAEHLAIIHPNIRVLCLCPMAVDTPFIGDSIGAAPLNSAVLDGIVSPDYVAGCVIDAIDDKEAFWIFPHKKVPKYIQIKANHHARWLKGMQRMRQRLLMQGNEQKLQSKL